MMQEAEKAQLYPEKFASTRLSSLTSDSPLAYRLALLALKKYLEPVEQNEYKNSAKAMRNY